MSNEGPQYPPRPPFDGGPQFQPAPKPPKPPKKPMSREARIGWMVLAGLGVFAVGLTVGAGGDPDARAVSSSPAPTVTVSMPGEPGAEVTVTAPPVTVTKPAAPAKTVTAPQPKAAAAIEEGTWEVGVDVAAGRYKTTEAVDSAGMCYWKITTTGKPDDIVDNDIVTGGRPTVTLKKGQDFTTQDCGPWTKVG